MGECNTLMIRKALIYFGDAEKEPKFPLIKKQTGKMLKIFLLKNLGKFNHEPRYKNYTLSIKLAL